MTLNYKVIINYNAKTGQMLLKKQKEHIIIDRFLITTTMWNVIKSAAVRKVENEDMHLLKVERNSTNIYQVISDAFSNYVLSVAIKILLIKIRVILYITYEILIIISQLWNFTIHQLKKLWKLLNI